MVRQRGVKIRKRRCGWRMNAELKLSESFLDSCPKRICGFFEWWKTKDEEVLATYACEVMHEHFSERGFNCLCVQTNHRLEMRRNWCTAICWP